MKNSLTMLALASGVLATLPANDIGWGAGGAWGLESKALNIEKIKTDL